MADTGTSGRTSAASVSRDHVRALGSEVLADLVLDLAREQPKLLDRLRGTIAERRRTGADEAAGARKPDEPYLVGASPRMRAVFEAIRRFAPTDSPILITGESGTGKELAALAIHERSLCASGPFVPINCAGLPPTLIGSDLFGHEKGAFTGAYQRKVGRIEAAQGGTVFLDEIGDLPLELQPHLLRFLQEKTIDRVGGHKPITVDVRVIAATNMDLSEAIKAGRFREDLFYRLNVLTLDMPPLRARGDDIDLLSTFFLQKFARRMNRPAEGFDEEALRLIREYHWPGNVRELVSCIRRAAVMCDGPRISARDLGFPLSSTAAAPRTGTTAAGRARAGGNGAPGLGNGNGNGHGHGATTLREAKREAELRLIQEALERNGQNIKQTAEALGVSRVTLYRLMKEHGLSAGGPERE